MGFSGKGVSLTETFLENNFGQQSPVWDSEPMQLGCMESCESPGRVQMHNPGRIHFNCF